MRVQLIRRGTTRMLWSRGEELLDDAFPEIAGALAALPAGTVLDGELLAWRDDAPRPFNELQTRLGRRGVEPSLFGHEVPVTVMAFDLLEEDGVDLREHPLVERRRRLERLLAANASREIRLAPRLDPDDWATCTAMRDAARDRGVEGLVLKRLAASYGIGRPRGAWWKWKVTPHTLDVVLVAAQPGHGRRAGLLTDYTFALWRDAELVTVTKAYSGLEDKELRELDRWLRRATLERHGPVRIVRPELVFEIAFDGGQPSPRHKAGLALRFPRITRWRRDKQPGEADHLETLQTLIT